MVRIRTAVASKKRKKRVLKQAKGQFGHRSKHFRQALKSVIRGMSYSFRDRKVKKRDFRSLWILRINAACRELGLSYSRFMAGLKTAGVQINRKMLAELAVSSPESFQALVALAKKEQKPTTAS